MNRKQTLALLTAALLVTSAVAGTGAFSSISADRDVSVTVTNDANAFLGLEPAEGTNGVYATEQNGQLQLRFDGTGTNAEGLNPNATTSFDDVFTVSNHGTQRVAVTIKDETNGVEFSAPTEDGTARLDGEDAVGVSLDPGDTVPVSVLIDSENASTIESLDSVTITADEADTDDADDAADTGDSPEDREEESDDSEDRDTDNPEDEPPASEPIEGENSVQTSGTASTGDTVPIDTASLNTSQSDEPSLDSFDITYADNTSYNTTLSVENEGPSEASEEPDGTPLKYVNVSHPETPDSAIENATFQFTVPDDAGNGTGAVQLVRYNETTDQWETAQTTVSFVEETDEGVVYQAETEQLSAFSLVELGQRAYVRTPETGAPIDDDPIGDRNAGLLFDADNEYPAGIYQTYREDSFNQNAWNEDATTDADDAAALIRERLRLDEQIKGEIEDWILSYAPTPIAAVQKVVAAVNALIDANEFFSEYGSGIQKQAVAIHVDPGAQSHDDLQANLAALETNTDELKTAIENNDSAKQRELLEEREELLKETYELLPVYTADVHQDVIGDSAGIEDPQAYHIIRSDVESLRVQLLADYEQTTNELYGAPKRSLAEDTSMPTHGWTTDDESVVYDTMDTSSDYAVVEINGSAAATQDADEIDLEVAGANVDEMDVTVVSDRPDQPRYETGDRLTGDGSTLSGTVDAGESSYVIVRADGAVGPVRIESDADAPLSVSERAGPDIQRPVADLVEGPEPVSLGDENTVYPTNDSEVQLTWLLWDAKTPTDELEYRFRADTGDGFTELGEWKSAPANGRVSPDLNYDDGITRVQLEVRDNAGRTAARNVDLVVSEGAPQTAVEAPDDPTIGDVYVRVLPERRIESVELQVRDSGNESWEDWQTIEDTDGLGLLTAPRTGDIDIRARATGLDGDTGDWDETSLTYEPPDTTSPDIELETAPSNEQTLVDGDIQTRRVTQDEAVPLEWTVDDDRTDPADLEYRVRESAAEWSSWQQATDGSVSVTAEAERAGSNATIEVRDEAGNVETDTVRLRRDTTAPEVTVSAGDSVTGGTINPDPNEPIQSIELEYRRSNDTAWKDWKTLGSAEQTDVPLDVVGSIDVRARAIDTAGNTGDWSEKASFNSLPARRSKSIDDEKEYNPDGGVANETYEQPGLDDFQQGLVEYDALVDEIDGELFIDMYVRSRDGSRYNISSVKLEEDGNQTIRGDLPGNLSADDSLEIRVRGNGSVVLDSLRAIGSEPSVPTLQANPSNATVNETVTLSIDPDWPGDTYVERYEWDTDGDGTIDDSTDEPTLEVAYDDPGERNVTLSVVDVFGETDSANTSVRVNAPPEPAFDVPRAVETGEAAVLNASASVDPDGEIVEYDWDTDEDGNTEETGETVEVDFADDGAYPVALSVTDDNGATTVQSQNLTVLNRPPQPVVAAETEQPIVDEPIELSATESVDPDGDIVEYEWNISEGSIDDTGKEAEATVDTYGTQSATLQLTDDDGATNTTEAEFYVNAPPEPTIDTPTEAFTDEAIALNASGSTDPDGSIDAYEWDIEGASDRDGSEETVRFPDDGNYTITLSVTDNNGTERQTSTEITVKNRPPTAAATRRTEQPVVGEPAAFDALDSFDPDGSVETVEWRFSESDGFEEGERVLNRSFDTPGTQTVTLRVTDDDGATNTTEAEFYVNAPPEPTITAPNEVPTGQPIEINGTESTDPDGRIVEYEWIVDERVVSDGSTEKLNESFDDDGTYPVTLRVRDNNGTVRSATHPVTVTNRPPDVDVEVPTENVTVNDEFSIDLFAADPDGEVENQSIEVVSPSGQRLSTNGTEYTVRPNETGVWRVTGSAVDDDAGKSESNQTVRVVEELDLSIESFDEPRVDEPFELEASSSGNITDTQYSWTIDGDQYTGKNVTVEPEQAGDLLVTLTVSDQTGNNVTTERRYDVESAASVELYTSQQLGGRILQGDTELNEFPYDQTEITWDLNGDGQYESSGGFRASVPVNQTGSYEIGVRAEGPNGTVDTDRKTVEIDDIRTDIGFEWVTERSENGTESSGPSTDGERVYTAFSAEEEDPQNATGVVEARSAENGSTVWRVETQGPVYETELIDDVLYASGQGVVAIDPSSGDVLWTLPREEYSTIEHAGDALVIESSETMMAVDLKTGERHWNVSTPGYVSEVDTVDERVVYQVYNESSRQDEIVARDSVTGDRLWIKNDSRNTEIHDVSETAIVYERNSYLTDGDVIAIEPESGQERWNASSSALSPAEDGRIDAAVVSDGYTYFVGTDVNGTFVTSVDDNGSERWSTWPEWNQQTSSKEIVIRGKAVYVASEEYLSRLNATTGLSVWTSETSSGYDPDIRFVESEVVVGSYDGASVVDPDTGDKQGSLSMDELESGVYNDGTVFVSSNGRVFAIDISSFGNTEP